MGLQVQRSHKFKQVLASALMVMALAAQPIYGLFASHTADAAPAPEVVYDALPSTTPATNYESEAFEATSTSEFGDYIHLAGTNRMLNTVTVTMSDWAKYSDYSSNPAYSGDSTNWTLPVTLNVYDNQFDANGIPTHKIATVTQTVSVPWVPEPFSHNGIAFDASFDLSSQHVTATDDIVVSVTFNTQHHGYAPTGQPGPYNSLNVAIPAGQTASTGSDNDTDGVLANSTWAGGYSGNSPSGDGGTLGIFRKSTTWAPYGTVAMKVTATTPPTITACSTTTTTKVASLTGWDISDTRSAGHYQFTGNGLHVWTDDATSNAKVAAYYPTNFALSATGTQNSATALEYASSLGSAPGLQLGVDLNNDGTQDGILVGEGQSYPGNVNDWWFTGALAGPHATSIFGHPAGTLDEWLAMYPDAQVKAIGFSLGSGVHADGTIKSITLGCTKYAFAAAAPTLVSPTNNQVIPSDIFNFDWDNVSGATSYEYQNSKVSGAVDANGKLTSVNFQATSPASQLASSGAGEVTRWWQVRAKFSDGSYTPWSTVWKVTIDKTAPVATIVTPTDGSTVSGTVHVKGTVADANPQNSYFSIYKVGSSAPIVTSLYSDGRLTHELDWDTTTVADGQYNIFFETRDKAGNKNGTTSAPGTSVKKVTVTVANPPVVADLSLVLAGDQNSLTVSGTITDSNLKDYNVRVYKGDKSGLVDPWIGATSTTAVTNDTLATLDTSTLSSGDYWVRIWADDLAGNRTGSGVTGNPQIYVPFTIDRDAPHLTIDSNLIDNGDGTYTVSGTTDDTADVILTIDGGTPVTVTPVGTVWSYTTALGTGSHTVTADSSDAAGNPAITTTRIFTITVVDTPTGTGGSPTGSPVTSPDPIDPATLASVSNGATGPAFFGFSQPAAADTDTSDDTSAVKGAETERNVAAASTNAPVQATSGGWKILGIMWYWWLLILAVILAALWFFWPRLRNREQEQ